MPRILNVVSSLSLSPDIVSIQFGIRVDVERWNPSALQARLLNADNTYPTAFSETIDVPLHLATDDSGVSLGHHYQLNTIRPLVSQHSGTYYLCLFGTETGILDRQPVYIQIGNPSGGGSGGNLPYPL